MERMKIEIWSDIACPYCYIGKRKMDKALGLFSHRDEIELVWHSYELNPDLPKHALKESFAQYFSKSHGMSLEQANAFCMELTELAKEADLSYHLDKVVVANTSDALRLIKLAKKYGKATEAEEVFFDAYFVSGLDVSDQKTLLLLGKQIGLDEKEIADMLKGKEFLAEKEKDIDYSDNVLNLEYIPFYRINNKHIIQGSIPESDYLEVLNKAYAEWKSGTTDNDDNDIISGHSCSIGGVCN